MARSEYVYVLAQRDQPPMAWTVKHELRAWLARLPAVPDDWRLWRVRDGRPEDATATMSIRELLEGP